VKRLAMGAAVAILVVVAVLAVLPFAVDLNRHKDMILTQIRTYTNRQVDFSEIRLTILSGLGAEIKNLRISDDPSFARGDFLTLKAAKVRVALLPLLSKEIKVSAVVLKEPRIQIVKNAAGTYNFSTLLTPRPSKKPRKPKPGVLATLLVSNVVVKNGMITYSDDKLGKESRPFAISNIDLESQDISLYKPVQFTMSASVMNPEGQNFALAGTVGPAPQTGGAAMLPLDVHLILDSLPLATLPLKTPFKAGSLKLDMTAKGSLRDKVSSRVTADIEGLLLSAPAAKPGATDKKGISCRLVSDLSLEMQKQQIIVDTSTFTIGKDRGSFRGSLKGFKTSPVWDMQIKSDSISPGPVLEQLPMFAGLVPGKIALSGPAGFSLSSTGSKTGFQVNAAGDMKAMAISFGKTFNKPAGSPMTFAGRMAITPDMTRIDALDINAGPIVAHGSGEVRKVQGTSRYKIDMETRPVSLQSAQSFIPMIQAFQPTGSVVVKTTTQGGTGIPMEIKVNASSESMGLVLSKPKEGEQTRSKVLSGPLKASMHSLTISVNAMKKDKTLTAKGALKSHGGTFMDIPYSTLSGTFSLENDLFRVSSLDLDALKGSMQGSASYNIRTKAWAASPAFNTIQAGSILDALTSFKGIFTGNMTGNLKATGIAGAPALNNLGAQGNLTISRGEWKNFDLAGTALSSILGVPGASEIFGFLPSEVQKYNSTRFESLNASIDLSRKVVHVDTMKLLNISSGKDMDTESNLKGTISMDTNEVHLKGNVVLPKRFSQRIGAKAEAFSSIMNDQKRLVLPITITGPVKKPVPMVEVKALSSAFTKYYATKALDKGLRKLQEKGSVPATDETRKSLDTMMEGLFKKKKK